MCTIGAVRLNSNETILFKNKDFADVSFNDKLISGQSYFGPLGLETFGEAGKDPVFSGLSLGANRHGLMACVNHVKSTGEGALNYDLLVQSVISESKSVDEGLECIKLLVSEQAYWWGNLVLADEHKVAAVEVRDSVCRYQIDVNRIFRTNHQPLFGQSTSPDDIVCSALRYKSTEGRLEHVSSVQDVISMLSTHDDQGGRSGICNHSESLKTVYSYVVHQKQQRISLYVCKGTPCNNAWEKLLLPLGKDWSPEAEKQFLQDYPKDKQPLVEMQ